MKHLRLTPKIKVVFILFSLLSIVVFFSQLYVTNTVNREGVEQVSIYEKEIAQYREEIDRLDQEIATYSAMERVEKRAKELGFEKRDATEYIR